MRYVWLNNKNRYNRLHITKFKTRLMNSNTPADLDGIGCFGWMSAAFTAHNSRGLFYWLRYGAFRISWTVFVYIVLDSIAADAKHMWVPPLSRAVCMTVTLRTHRFLLAVVRWELYGVVSRRRRNDSIIIVSERNVVFMFTFFYRRLSCYYTERVCRV